MKRIEKKEGRILLRLGGECGDKGEYREIYRGKIRNKDKVKNCWKSGRVVVWRMEK